MSDDLISCDIRASDGLHLRSGPLAAGTEAGEDLRHVQKTEQSSDADVFYFYPGFLIQSV